MDNPLIVPVTAADLAHGVRHSCTECPLARALRRADGRAWVVSRTDATSADGRHLVRLPRDVRGWVEDFDDGLPAGPRTFVLDVEER